jgi:hypothetical protein
MSSATHREGVASALNLAHTETAAPQDGRLAHAMRRMMTCMVALALAGSPPCGAQTSSWKKLRYAGGTLAVSVNPYDWDTTLTAAGDAIVVNFAHGIAVQKLRIKPAHVTALSYGEVAHRRVSDIVAEGVLFPPLALFGLLHKSKAHLIGIEYRASTSTVGKVDFDIGKPGAILLEADKNNYRAILLVLKAVTGKPVENAP